MWVSDLDGTGMGGIYPRADIQKGGYLDRGIGPKVNAAKPPGEWNTLDVVWKSPRFDAKGEKRANAMVVKATLNGQLIHENVEIRTPTGGNWMKKETASGSFMLQSDHGPTAWRNVPHSAFEEELTSDPSRNDGLASPNEECQGRAN